MRPPTSRSNGKVIFGFLWTEDDLGMLFHCLVGRGLARTQSEYESAHPLWSFPINLLTGGSEWTSSSPPLLLCRVVSVWWLCLEFLERCAFCWGVHGEVTNPPTFSQLLPSVGCAGASQWHHACDLHLAHARTSHALAATYVDSRLSPRYASTMQRCNARTKEQGVCVRMNVSQ